MTLAQLRPNRVRFALLALALILPAPAAWAQSTGAAALSAQADPSEADLPQLVVQLPAGPGTRTAGLLLAAERGYFAAAGVDIVLQRAGDGQSPSADLADGSADLAVDIMASALRARAEGAGIVHVAQFFQQATLGLICRPEVDQPGKLAGENVGVWLGGWESSFYAWLSRLGLSYFATGGGVTILRQAHDAELFLAREVDCMTSTTYLAPLQLAELGESRGQLVAYRYETLGLGVLEDGLYARAEDLQDPARLDAFARFLAAAQRGWQAVIDDPAAAVKLLDGRAGSSGIDPALLSESLAGVVAALNPESELTFRLDPAAYDRSVNLLLTGAPEPILKAAPDGAVSDAVWKQRRALGRLAE